MKATILLFLCTFGMFFGQELDSLELDRQNKELTFKLDSIGIVYQPEIAAVLYARNTITDELDKIIFAAKYDKNTIEQSVYHINNKQNMYILPNDFRTEEKAVSIRKAIWSATEHDIVAKKSLLLALFYREYAENLKKKIKN